MIADRAAAIAAERDIRMKRGPKFAQQNADDHYERAE